MSAPFLSFVIPVRDDAGRLRRCLASIAGNRAPAPYELIVVDNGSEDGSAAVAAEAGATVIPLPTAKVSEARNVGAARAAAPLLAFVDADHELAPGWLTAAAAIFGDEGVAGAGAPYASPVDVNWVQRAYAGFRPQVVGQERTDWLGSGNMILRRTAFHAVGGFDTGLESCEDVDLCNRLANAGYPLVADARLRSVHLGDPKTLRALFFGELWRGRDNIKVSLRGPLTLSAIPSLLIPIVDLFLFALLLASPWLGLQVAAGAVLLFLLLSVLRAVRMTRRLGSTSLLQALQNLAVAATYDAARACALVVRATHRTRRETAGERVVA